MSQIYNLEPGSTLRGIVVAVKSEDILAINPRLTDNYDKILVRIPEIYGIGESLEDVKKTNVSIPLSKVQAAVMPLLDMSGAAGNADTSKLTGDVKTVVDQLCKNGYNTAAACGIVGNIYYESGFNTASEGDYENGVPTSFGICQWHDDRGTKMKSQVSDWKNNLTGQVDFLCWELSNNYKGVDSYLKGVSNTREGAQNAADKFVRDFEVPANINNESTRRQAKAAEYWDTMTATTETEGEEGKTDEESSKATPASDSPTDSTASDNSESTSEEGTAGSESSDTGNTSAGSGEGPKLIREYIESSIGVGDIVYVQYPTGAIDNSVVVGIAERAANTNLKESKALQFIEKFLVETYGENYAQLLQPTSIVGSSATVSAVNYNPKYGKYFGLPLPSGTFRRSSPYGKRWGRMHYGVDLTGGGFEGTPVYAVGDGTVTEVNSTNTNGGGYGLYVKIDHGTIEGEKFETFYAHFSAVSVSVGQRVSGTQVAGRAATQVGLGGNTGHSYGAHLHFEVRVNGTQNNPENYIKLS